MCVRNVTWIGKSIAVLIVALTITSLRQKFNHSTALGSKVEVHDCVIKLLDGSFSTEKISITTDEYSMKHVHAETDMGAIYGMGFVHAMDRLWQLEFYRKLAQGRLSEILGDETVSLDKYIRTIGLPRMADYYMQKEWHPTDLVMVENYVSGINQLVKNLELYPVEFYILW